MSAQIPVCVSVHVVVDVSLVCLVLPAATVCFSSCSQVWYPCHCHGGNRVWKNKADSLHV